MRLSLLRLAAVVMLLCGLAGGGAAEGVPRSVALPPHVTELRLIEGWRRDDGAEVAAIVIRLESGWYTYWRVPGGSGFPPEFDWSASKNLASVSYEWPRPAIFDSFGERTFGFKRTLVLPVVLTPRDPGKPLDAAVDLAFGVCNDICIRAEARLTGRFDGDAPRTGNRATIQRALDARPVDAGDAGVTGAACSLGVDPAGPTVTADVTFASPPAPGLITVIEVENRPDLWIGETETRTAGARLNATGPLASASPSGSVALDRSDLRVTLLDADRAIDIRGCPGRG